MASCKPVNPAEPEVQPVVIDKDSVLKAMLQYFPYSKSDSITFIHEGDNQQWIIKPYTGLNSSQTFPQVMSEKWTEGDVEEWENRIDAEFVVSGVGNLYRTEFIADLHTQGFNGFRLHWTGKIRFEAGQYYSGSMTMDMDSATLTTFFTDTISVPLKYFGADKSSKSETLPEGAEMHFVKNEGLTDFCVDGKTIWRRVK